MVNFYVLKCRNLHPFSSVIALLVLLPGSGISASWTKTTNPAPFAIQLMVQMTDGTILAQSYNDVQTWGKLTPDSSGNYVNGTWTVLGKALLPRLYFASQVLQDGRFWIAGGEYSGPGVLANWGNSGEIYDPVANTWTAIKPFPAQAGCPSIRYVSGNLVSGSPSITNIYPYTTRLTVGEGVSGTGIPTGSTILSIDSPNSITISANATSTGNARTINLANAYTLIACLGDEPSILLPAGIILVGDLVNRNTWLYNVTTDSWSMTGAKVYNESSDEEGWAKLPNGTVINYDLFQSKATGGGYAEIYDPVAGTWSPISPSDGTANGAIPQLSSNALGSELGPLLRLQDGRIIVIGATQHTGIYTPSTNTWAAGPDIIGTLSNSANPGGTPSPFGADDAPAAALPNGHVIFAADAGASQFTSTGNITTGSSVVSNIPSTSIIQVGWGVTGTGIPANTTVASVVSGTQITMSANATTTTTGVSIKFGGVFSRPTQLFDFNPTNNTISPLTPAIPDGNLATFGVYPCRMLALPTGQVMFTDGGTQPWVYTPDGSANPALKPVINNITYSGGGLFTLTGKQLNGQSAGAAYGDDDQMDTNYPLVRLTATDGSGKVFYARTTNWSSVAVGGGLTAPQTVNFTLNPALTTPGSYALAVGGAGIASLPVFVNITQAEINKQ